jgi:hypothetical protein
MPARPAGAPPDLTSSASARLRRWSRAFAKFSNSALSRGETALRFTADRRFPHHRIAWNDYGRVIMPARLYMIIERFKNSDPVPVYRRFQERGRMAPDGLRYVVSWVEDELGLCYQIMETENPTLLREWMANWEDLVDFEVHPVLTSEQALERVRPRL